jgi:peptidoglycan/LPS O-acetylase OafA/YrhL
MNSINFVNVLRAFAAFLIVNSHSDKLFPEGFSALGTGGSIGNAIFFFTSGYTLSLGIRKSKPDYLPWLQKRLLRLYPSFLVFALFSLLVFKARYDWYDWFVFNGSWFLQAIIVYYVIFFPLIKYLDKYLGMVMLINYLAFACFFLFTYNEGRWTIDIMSNPTRIHWVYYFMIMLLGAVVSKNDSIFNRYGKLYLKEKKMSWFVLSIIIAGSVALFYTPKLIFTKLNIDCSIQFIYPILLIIVTYPFYLVSVRVSSYLKSSSHSFIRQSVIFVSNLTLDIYIVHFSIIHSIGKSDIVFPVNYILALVLILIFSYVLNKTSDWLFNLFSEKPKPASQVFRIK